MDLEAAGNEPQPTPSLNLSSEQFNAQTPQKFEQTSVLQPFMSSGNGMSEQDASMRVPGMDKPLIPNGSSAESAQQSMYMRLQGRRAI